MFPSAGIEYGVRNTLTGTTFLWLPNTHPMSGWADKDAKRWVEKENERFPVDGDGEPKWKVVRRNVGEWESA